LGKKKSFEHPNRIAEFLQDTINLDWSDFYNSMNKLYEHINKLCQAEIEYYYRGKKQKRILSGTIKILTGIFFTLGLLSPLLNNIEEIKNLNIDLLNWGYIFIGLTGILYLIDNLFTGSSGHIRYVTTQLRLEKEITLFRISWNRLLANDEKNKSVYFDVLTSFSSTFYQIINEETAQWSAEIEAALEEINKKHGK
jgi:hypothetical protein